MDAGSKAACIISQTYIEILYPTTTAVARVYLGTRFIDTLRILLFDFCENQELLFVVCVI